MRDARLHRPDLCRLHRAIPAARPRSATSTELRRVQRSGLHAGQHAVHLQRRRRLHRGGVRARVRQLRHQPAPTARPPSRRRRRPAAAAFPSTSARSGSPRSSSTASSLGDRARRIVLHRRHLHGLGRLRSVVGRQGHSHRDATADGFVTKFNADGSYAWTAHARRARRCLDLRARAPRRTAAWSRPARTRTPSISIPGAAQPTSTSPRPVADRSLRRRAGRQRNRGLGPTFAGSRLGSYGASARRHRRRRRRGLRHRDLLRHVRLRSRRRHPIRTRHRAAAAAFW